MTPHIHARDYGAVVALLKYAMKALHADAMRAACSGKDGVAPFERAGMLCEFIIQPEPLQCTDSSHEVAQAGDLKTPVQSTGFIANADNHRSTATIAASLGCHGSNYLLIVGAWACPINDLRLHSSLSGCDLAMLTYAAKYLHKAAGAQAMEVGSI